MGLRPAEATARGAHGMGCAFRQNQDGCTDSLAGQSQDGMPGLELFEARSIAKPAMHFINGTTNQPSSLFSSLHLSHTLGYKRVSYLRAASPCIPCPFVVEFSPHCSILLKSSLRWLTLSSSAVITNNWAMNRGYKLASWRGRLRSLCMSLFLWNRLPEVNSASLSFHGPATAEVAQRSSWAEMIPLHHSMALLTYRNIVLLPLKFTQMGNHQILISSCSAETNKAHDQLWWPALAV